MQRHATGSHDWFWRQLCRRETVSCVNQRGCVRKDRPFTFTASAVGGTTASAVWCLLGHRLRGFWEGSADGDGVVTLDFETTGSLPWDRITAHDIHPSHTPHTPQVTTATLGGSWTTTYQSVAGGLGLSHAQRRCWRLRPVARWRRWRLRPVARRESDARATSVAVALRECVKKV